MNDCLPKVNNGSIALIAIAAVVFILDKIYLFINEFSLRKKSLSNIIEWYEQCEMCPQAEAGHFSKGGNAMMTNMGRRERKKLQSKKTILAAAVELFTAKGVRDTSIADIMNTADLGIGTFYNYFESKDAVLLCLLEKLVEQIQDYAKKKIEAGYPAGDILGSVANLTAELLAEHRYVLPLFLSAAEHSDLPAGQGAHLPAPAFKAIFGNIIRYGQMRAEFREEIPAEIVTEMFHAIFQAASFSTLHISFQENISLKIKLILEGIVPRS